MSRCVWLCVAVCVAVAVCEWDDVTLNCGCQARDQEHSAFDKLKELDGKLFTWFEGFLERTHEVCRLAGSIIELKVSAPCRRGFNVSV